MTATLNVWLMRDQEVHSILSSVGLGAIETISWKDMTDYQQFLVHKPTTGMEITEEKNRSTVKGQDRQIIYGTKVPLYAAYSFKIMYLARNKNFGGSKSKLKPKR